MAVIGSFGDVVFEVSERKTQTFSEFQRTNEPRWIEHAIRGEKPLLEFEGPGLDPISFNLILRAELGVNPEKLMEKLRKFSRRGQRALFIRGGKPISSNFWIIKKLVETHRTIDNKGNVLTIEVKLDLLEYVLEQASNLAQKKTVSSVKSASSSTKKSIGKMTITVKSVHIRSGPGANNKILGYAMRGDTLTVYGEKNGWYALGGGRYISANSAYSTFKKG